MAEELPDGTRGGYEGYCPKCGEIIKTNSQGNCIDNHLCESQLLEKMLEDIKNGYIVSFDFKIPLSKNKKDDTI